MTRVNTAIPSALQLHLESGLTTICRAWSITRRDGVRLGFTDHDQAFGFDGLTFKPDTGLSSLALEQSTGLSVDNTEAIGALSDAAIRDEDIDAGRYDAAEVQAWMVNWTDVTQRALMFRGNIGEIRRAGGAFTAELRGLTDSLNRPIGRVYQKPCGAVLGDSACKIYLLQPQFMAEASVVQVENDRIFRFGGLDNYAPDWFERGSLTIQSGSAQGLSAAIKVDRAIGALREITLWEPLRAPVAIADQVQLLAGCDKRFETCKVKFNNVLNFRGFPDIPEEEWVMLHPSKAASTSGGSRR